jgi:hypothetical protein
MLSSSRRSNGGNEFDRKRAVLELKFRRLLPMNDPRERATPRTKINRNATW